MKKYLTNTVITTIFALAVATIGASTVYAQTLISCPPGAIVCNTPTATYQTPVQGQLPQTATLSTPGASTGVPGTVSGYAPLEPLTQHVAYANFADYLSTVYKLAITIGALIAVVMLVTGGVRYMLSESFTDIDKAKTRIKNALWGLLILVGSFLILYTINPNLLNFSALNQSLIPVTQKASNFNAATGNNNTNNYAKTSLVQPLQYSDQNSNDPATSKAISNFILQCQQQNGFVVKTAGSDPNTTVETCQFQPGLY